MANVLEIFGLRLAVADGVVKPPDAPRLRVRDWEASLAGDALRLVATVDVAGRWTLDLRLDVRLDEEQGVLRPRAGGQPQGPDARLRLFPLGAADGRRAVDIETSIVRVHEAEFEPDRVHGADGELVFEVIANHPFSDISLPIVVSRRTGSTLRLRLGEPTELQLDAGFFVAAADVKVLFDDGLGTLPMSVFRSEHGSRPVALPLASPDDTVKLALDPLDPDTCLMIHGESVGDEVTPRARAGVGVRDHCLVLEVAPNAVTAEGHRIDRVCVEPANAQRGFCVEAYGWAHRGNEVARFRSRPAGQTPPLDLHVRPQAGVRAGSFLVAPVHGRGPEQEQLFLEPEGRAAETAIHGPLDHGRFVVVGHGCLVCEQKRPPTSNPPSSVAASLVSEATMPWLLFPQASEARSGGLEHAKPGESHVGSATTDVVNVKTLRFQGGAQVLPLLDVTQLRDGDDTIRDTVLTELNTVWSTQKSDIPTTLHETGYGEKGPNVTTRRVFQALDEDPATLRLAPHEVQRTVGPFKVHLTTEDEAERPDYVVLRKRDGQSPVVAGDWTLPPDTRVQELKLGGEPLGDVVGVLKLSQRYDLRQIFARENDLKDLRTGDNPQVKVFDVLDDTVKQQGWIGLLLFDLPLDFSDFEVLSKLAAAGSLRLVYLALTPASRSQTSSDRDFSVQGKVRWTNPTQGTDTRLGDSETTVRTNLVEITWHDNRLNHFLCDVDVTVVGLFGLEHAEGERQKIKIIGSYDEDKDTFRFLGQLGDRLPILPGSGGFGPFEQVYLKGAEIRAVKGRVSVLLEGDFELQKFGFDSDASLFRCEDGCRVRFKGFEIPLKVPTDNFAKWLSYLYPSVIFDFNGPHFDLGFIDIKMQCVGVEFPGKQFDWGQLLDIHSPDLGERPAFILCLRMTLMRMPELTGIDTDRLSFDLVFGFGVVDGGWDLSKVRVGIRAFSLSKVRIPLLRFLEISADEVAVKQQRIPGEQETVPWLALSNVDVRILDTQVIDDLSIFVFSRRAGRQVGFVGYLPAEVDAFGILKIHWVLVGQNVDLGTDLARRLVAVDLPPGQANQQLREELKKAIDERQFLPQAAGSSRGEWVVAAGLSVLGGFIDGKLLFQDRRYYGLALGGGILKEWFGYDLAISVLYIQGDTRDRDAFFLALRVPMVVLPAFTFQGGVIEILVGVDGSFMVDVGFPWLDPRGGRQWHRCFGAIFSIYQGSAGFYLAKRQLTTAGGNYLQLAGGYACQAGFGASFGGGIFKVWVTIGFYTVFDGEMFLQDKNLRGLRLTGAVGVLFRGAGEIDWWIISVRVEIMLSLEARATLLWGTVPQGNLLPADTTAERDGAVVVLTFEAAARASARACIGSGWFKVCKSIQVSAVLRLSTTLKL